MPKYTFLISGDLGKKANFTINTENETLLIQAKRKIRFNLKYFIFHVSLEYHYAGLANFSLLAISASRIIKDYILFPKLVSTFLFFRYQIIFESSKRQMTVPDLYFLNENRHYPLWASRQAQIKGFRCWTSDHDLEWDMFRGESKKGYLLDFRLQGQSCANENLNNGIISPMSIKRIDSPQFGTLRVMNLKNIFVDRTQVHLKDGIAFPVHNFDFIEKTSIPTPLISSTQKGNFLYTSPKVIEANITQLLSIPYSESWYHFVVEGLGALLSQDNSILNTPVLIRRTCPDNIRQILKYLTGHDPVPIDFKSSLNVENLTIIQEWRYDQRFDFKSRVDDLHKVRNSLLNLLESRINEIDSKLITHENLSEVVFLTRPNRLYRQMENYNESIYLLKQNNVTVIEPSSMNFLESCRIINRAKILIAETGAAMTNIIFCNRDVQIVEINPEGFDSDFWGGFSEIFSFGHYRINAPTKRGTFKQKFLFPTEEIRQYLLTLR